MLKKFTTPLLLLCVLAVIGVVVTTSQTKPTPVIKIGALYPLTGPVATLGEQFKNGALLAVDDINKKERSRKFELVLEDSQMDPKIAVSAAQKLINADQIKIIHSLGSGVGLAVKPITEQNGVLLFSDAAHPNITKDSRVVLRHSNIAEKDAEVLVEAIRAHTPKTIGLIYINDDWGKAFLAQYQKFLLMALPNLVIKSEAHSSKETNFRTVLLKLTQEKPDIVVIASFGSAPGVIVNQLKELGFQGKIFLNVGLILSADAQKIAGDNLKGVYYQTFEELPSEFVNRYVTIYGKKPGLFELFAYTDIELIRDAIQKVGENPTAMASSIKKLGTFSGTYETVTISSQGDIVVQTHMEQWK